MLGTALKSGVRAGGATVALATATVLVLVLAAPGAQAAQPATPVAGIDTPRPDECRVDPIPLPIALPPVAATPTALLPDPASLPTGEPADDEIVAGVIATVRESIACRNAGDLRRAYALMTPQLLAGLLGAPETAPPEIIAGLLEPNRRVPRTERVTLVAVSDIALLPDGLVRARVETEAAGYRFADLLLFVRAGDDDRWLIDDALPLGRQPVPRDGRQ